MLCWTTDIGWTYKVEECFRKALVRFKARFGYGCKPTQVSHMTNSFTQIG
jgi:hypothetical protein